MATPKPGEIRCPTCHRSTPPAAFCTQCGSAIPSDARIRPRGMDRDELQDRIRARRATGDPYRRGNVADEGYTGYERFQPEPEDTQARRVPRPDEHREDSFQDRVGPLPPPVPIDPRAESLVPPLGPPPDITRDSDDWAVRPPVEPSPPPVEPPLSGPPPASAAAADEPAYVDGYDDAAYDDAYAYGYEDWDDGRERRSSGAGAFAILGFLALGVLALLGGAVLAGVFSGDPNTAGADPTLGPSPTLSESFIPSEAASAAPSAAASDAPSGSPGASGDSVVFPDGFTAVAEPCLPGTMRRDGTGCDSNGATNNGSVEIYVGFAKGNSKDVIGAEVIGPDGSTVDDGSIDLADIECRSPCGGWTFFTFGNLDEGTYEVLITRNGDRASSTSFEVS